MRIVAADNILDAVAMAVCGLLGCIALMSSSCYAYPPQYTEFWQHDPSSTRTSHVSPWDSPGTQWGDSYATRRSGGGGSDFRHDPYYHSGTGGGGGGYRAHHRHHEVSPQVDQHQQLYGRAAPEEGRLRAASGEDTGVYGAVPARDPAGDNVSGRGLPGVQGQGLDSDANQLAGAGGATARRKSQQIVNGRRGRRNNTVAFNPEAPQVQRRPDGTLALVYPNHRSTATRAADGPSSGSSDFIFPHSSDEDETKTRPAVGTEAMGYVPVVKDRRKGPDCAKGSTFCEEVDDYPHDLLSNLLQKEAKDYLDLFGSDEVESAVNVTNRIDSMDEQPMCDSMEEIVHPQVAQNKDNDWLYIINQEGYTQGVRVETCLSQNSKCKAPFELPLDYETSCKQKYIYRKMVAFNGTSFTSDSFRMPSCCSCFFRMSRAAQRIATPFRLQGQSPAVKSRGSTYH